MTAATAIQQNVQWREHRGARLAARNGHEVIACEICGFSHAVPLPDPEALEREYRETYYAEEKPTYLLHAGEDQDWARLAQIDRLDALARLLPANRRRLLDIGSGPGFFVKTAVEQDWQAEGIEPSRQAAAHATTGASVSIWRSNRPASASCAGASMARSPLSALAARRS